MEATEKVDLAESAHIALTQCLGVKSGEKVLIITDEFRRKIGYTLWEKAKELGAEAMILEIIPRKNHGEEPPEAVAEAMKRVDVFICPTTKSLTHTTARENANKAGARGATLPSVTEDMMMRTLSVDYNKVAEISLKFTKLLNEGKKVRVTTPAGTDITFSIEGREADPDTGLYLKPGEFGNLPAGEAYIAPVEETANGVIVVDGAMSGGGGIVEEHIRMKVEKGYAVKIEGGKAASILNETLDSVGPLARNIAEFGIGTNFKAIITGNILEDEKVSDTVHFALGNNAHFGGKVDVPLHLDGILLKPTVEIDGKVIIKDGKHLI